VGAAVVVGLGVVLIVGPLFTEEASFTLARSGTSCQVSVPPGDLWTGWYRKVTWHVHNQDCDSQFVSLQNFKPVLGGGTYGAPKKVLAPDPLQRPVATGATVDLQATVVGFSGLGHFKYEIWLGLNAGSLALALDPDIDIWP
jgi:hypothetical protein